MTYRLSHSLCMYQNPISTDPESFVRRGPTVTLLFLRREDPNTIISGEIISQSAKRHLNTFHSKEPSRWDDSFDYPKQMLKLMDKKIFTILSLYFCYYRDENLPLFRGFPLFWPKFAEINCFRFDSKCSNLLHFEGGKGGFLFFDRNSSFLK